MAKQKDKKKFDLFLKFKELEKQIVNEIGQKMSCAEDVNQLSATYVNLTTAVAGSFSIDIGQARQKIMEAEWKLAGKKGPKGVIPGDLPNTSDEAAKTLVITDNKEK